VYFECVWLLYRRLFDCFSVICNKTFYQVYTLFSHTPHHTKSALGSRGRDSGDVGSWPELSRGAEKDHL